MKSLERIFKWLVRSHSVKQVATYEEDLHLFFILHQRFSDPFGSFRFNCVQLISFRNSRKALMMLHIVEKKITYELQMHSCTVFKVNSELSNFTIEM